MTLPIYQIDAFAEKLFSGNPAAVCPLTKWLPADTMQNIAMENNLAETAFFVKSAKGYNIRWFTPTTEVDLCGHATLAAAYVVYHFMGHSHSDKVDFYSEHSGHLQVSMNGNDLTLNFPTDVYHPVNLSSKLLACFDHKPVEAYKGKTDYLLIYDNEEDIINMKADINAIAHLTDSRGVIISALGKKYDFVSRFFAPQAGVNEDPVTGSAHTTLTPYWAEKLGKNQLIAKQLSNRGGLLKCHHMADRIEISGECQLYLKGEILAH